MAHGSALWLPAIVQPIATVAISVVGAIIARGQWLTSNEKFRYDLFQKRYDIYKEVASHLRAMMRDGGEYTDFFTINKLEDTVTEVTLFYGSSIVNSVQQAVTSAKRLHVIKTGDIDFQMSEETLDSHDKLSRNIDIAGTETLSKMLYFIDFSRSGRPPKHRYFWFSRLFRR